jgi:hypothetical protein
VNCLSLSPCSSADLSSHGSVAWGSSAGKSDLCCGRLLDVVGRPGLHQSGLESTFFADCSSPGPRKNDLTIYWALGPFVRSFTLLVDPGDICPPHSLTRVDACNPLLQAHPTWARDEHEGRGISTSLMPVSGHLSPPVALGLAPTHLGWGTRRHSLVGPGTPRSRNADKFKTHLFIPIGWRIIFSIFYKCQKRYVS